MTLSSICFSALISGPAIWKYASIQVCKHASWKVYMQLSKNKGMYDVCMQLCKYVDLQILKFQLCKYESMEIFMYISVQVCKYARK